MAGLADTVAGALGVKPAVTPPGYNGRVPDSESRAILAEEARKYPDNPDIRREIELRFPDMAKTAAPAAPAAAEAAPASFSAGPVLEALQRPAAKPAPHVPGTFEKTLDAGLALPQTIANQVSGIGAGILGGWHGIATLARGGTMEDAANAVHQAAAEGTYRPEEGSAGAKVVGALESSANPLNWPGMAAHKAGEVVNDVTGSPAAGAAVETLGNVVIPGAVAKGLKLVPRGRSAPPIVDAEVLPPKETSLAAIAQGEDRRLPPVTPTRAAAEPVKAAAAAGPTAEQTAAARTPKPGETPPETAARAAEELAPKFSEAEPRAPAGQALASDEQRRRSEVLARVGIAPEEQRVSAVRGDGTGASTDFQQSRVDNEAGRLIKTKLEAEREALANHSEGLVRQTGGSLGTDGQTLETRGHVILAPLDSLKTWFDKQTRALYNAADERAAGVPTEMPETHAIIGGDTAEFLGTTDGEALLRGVKARMKSLGMLDAEGAAKPATVEQAERLKQYLGDVWQPRTGKLIRKLKDAIDEDVTRSAGEDIYQQARAMRAMRSATLDNPNGIAKIMDASGPEGINRAVPVERVADAITAMPNAQFAHIIETLKNVPPELRPQAGEALAEIKAQFANRVRDAGMGRAQGAQWNAREVSTYLNKNAAKLSQVFSPEELAGFRDLNDAGLILAHDRSYPGAAVQADNLLRRGALAVLPKVAAGVGGAVGALVGAPGTGALVGSTAGAKAAATMAERSALKNAQSRFGVRLSDFPK